VNIEEHIKQISAENVRNYRKLKAQENERPQASTSTDPTQTPIMYNYDQANEYFQNNFIGNPFGYAFDIHTCDRLRHMNDLKQAREKNCNFLPRRGSEDMPYILTGDFNVNAKDNYNAELVEFMKDIFGLDILSDLSQGTTRSNSCIDMVSGRNVYNLSCMNYVLYFSYHRHTLNTIHQQAPQPTHVTTNKNAWVNLNK
jgi:hypothetical protein